MVKIVKNLRLVGLAILSSIVVSTANAAESVFEINSEESIFAVVTKKEGVASGFAHDHFISASNYSANVTVTDDNILKGKFAFVVPVKSLVADNNEQQLKFFPNLKALGIQNSDFSKISESDRNKIRENMFSKSQLDLENHPEINGELISLTAEQMDFGGKKFEQTAEFSFTVKGKTITKKLPASVKLTNKKLTVETVGKYTFSEFGITPYSAMLGAVRNADAFHLYVTLVANSK